MKKLILLTSLTIGLPLVTAQQAPNRENSGTAPDATPGSTAGTPDKPPGIAGSGGETASDRSPDEGFIRKAGESGQMEVNLAEMAANKASRDDIKAFAAMLMKDHSAANAELGKIAKSLGVDIAVSSEAHSGKTAHARSANDPSGRQLTETPKDPSKDGATDKHLGLKEKSGASFDAAFMEAMNDCHKEDIALFEKAQAVVKTPALKAFITKTLPVLKTHATALAALEKKDPSRPDARTGSPAETPAPRTPATDGIPPNR